MAARPTYSVFALTDEAYALTTTEQANSWASRRIAFIALARSRVSTTVDYLSTRMPAGVMVISSPTAYPTCR